MSAETCSGWTRVMPPDTGSGPHALQDAASTSPHNASAVGDYNKSSHAQWETLILHWSGIYADELERLDAYARAHRDT
jgi:hypothetical protein